MSSQITMVLEEFRRFLEDSRLAPEKQLPCYGVWIPPVPGVFGTAPEGRVRVLPIGGGLENMKVTSDITDWQVD